MNSPIYSLIIALIVSSILGYLIKLKRINRQEIIDNFKWRQLTHLKNSSIKDDTAKED